jgi:acyl dehydratase
LSSGDQTTTATAGGSTSSTGDQTTTVHVSDLPTLAGKDLGTSRWVEITQDHIDKFADLTGDRQWIHIDTERAKSSPYGTTLAHGFFTLSLSTVLLYELLEVEGTTSILNYGLNGVRFPSTNPAGSRVRMKVSVPTVEEVRGGYQITFALTFEREGQDKPVCVAELLFRYYGPE